MTDASNVPADDEATENVYAPPFGVNVSFPQTISIRMVDASALGDYEILLLFVGLFCNVFCGFAVAAVTATANQVILTVISVVFFVFTVGFAVWALFKRSVMTKKSKTFKIGTGKVEAVSS